MRGVARTTMRPVGGSLNTRVRWPATFINRASIFEGWAPPQSDPITAISIQISHVNWHLHHRSGNWRRSYLRLGLTARGRRPTLGQADANYSTKLRRIKNEPNYKSWGRHWLHLDAPGVLASNANASTALHFSNQFSLRRSISGNKRQLGLWSLRSSLACRFRQYSKIMISSCMLSSCLLVTPPICKPQIHGTGQANCRR